MLRNGIQENQISQRSIILNAFAANNTWEIHCGAVGILLSRWLLIKSMTSLAKRCSVPVTIYRGSFRDRGGDTRKYKSAWGVKHSTCTAIYNIKCIHIHLKLWSGKLAYLQWLQDGGEPRLELIRILYNHFQWVRDEKHMELFKDTR